MLGKSVNNQMYFWLEFAGHPRWVRFQCKWETLTWLNENGYWIELYELNELKSEKI